jgi:hypothetical protein
MSNAKTVKLESGVHGPGEGKACVMEVVSMLAGESFTDSPECACPVLSEFARQTNDWMKDDERHLLWPFTTRLAGSKADRETEQKRTYRMADWACREVTPLALEAASKDEAARSLRELAPVTDRESAAAAHAYAAHAAYAAHGAYAARTAAAHAAYAARTAAAHAAYAAHAAAADYAYRPTILQMRLDLLDELCPPAPLPSDVVTAQIARELEAAA